MGRVRRYKKEKKVENWKPNKEKFKKNAVYDLPPNVLNHMAQRSKRGEKAAKRIKLPEEVQQNIYETAVVEREKARLRRAGKLLPEKNDDANKETSSGKKRKKMEVAIVDRTARRKNRMKEIRQLKKLKKSGGLADLLMEGEMNDAKAGIERPQKDFRAAEQIKFGETVEAPPKIETIPKTKGGAVKKKPWIQSHPHKQMNEMEQLREETMKAYAVLKKRRASEANQVGKRKR